MYSAELSVKGWDKANIQRLTYSEYLGDVGKPHRRNQQKSNSHVKFSSDFPLFTPDGESELSYVQQSLSAVIEAEHARRRRSGEVEARKSDLRTSTNLDMFDDVSAESDEVERPRRETTATETSYYRPTGYPVIPLDQEDDDELDSISKQAASLVVAASQHIPVTEPPMPSEEDGEVSQVLPTVDDTTLSKPSTILTRRDTTGSVLSTFRGTVPSVSLSAQSESEVARSTYSSYAPSQRIASQSLGIYQTGRRTALDAIVAKDTPSQMNPNASASALPPAGPNAVQERDAILRESCMRTTRQLFARATTTSQAVNYAKLEVGDGGVFEMTPVNATVESNLAAAVGDSYKIVQCVGKAPSIQLGKPFTFAHDTFIAKSWLRDTQCFIATQPDGSVDHYLLYPSSLSCNESVRAALGIRESAPLCSVTGYLFEDKWFTAIRLPGKPISFANVLMDVVAGGTKPAIRQLYKQLLHIVSNLVGRRIVHGSLALENIFVAKDERSPCNVCFAVAAHWQQSVDHRMFIGKNVGRDSLIQPTGSLAPVDLYFDIQQLLSIAEQMPGAFDDLDQKDIVALQDACQNKVAVSEMSTKLQAISQRFLSTSDSQLQQFL